MTASLPTAEFFYSVRKEVCLRMRQLFYPFPDILHFYSPYGITLSSKCLAKTHNRDSQSHQNQSVGSFHLRHFIEPSLSGHSIFTHRIETNRRVRPSLPIASKQTVGSGHLRPYLPEDMLSGLLRTVGKRKSAVLKACGKRI